MSKKPVIKSVPTSTLGRAGRLLGAGAQLLVREVGGRLSNAVGRLGQEAQLNRRLEQAQALVESLSQLKGAAMKTGQILSLELSDLLPPEVTAILRKLHDDSAFLPFDAIEKILRKELSPELREKITALSEEPIAAASIGQVHRAKLEGRAIAIKIQFPGVGKTIHSDLAIVKRALQSIIWMQNRQIPLDDVFDEIERVLRQEVDYLREAKYLGLFRDLVKDFPQFVVPTVYSEFSTRRILCLSFEEGMRLKDWLNREHSEEEKSIFAKHILTLLFNEFFLWGLVQTDPNYGNFLYRPEKQELVLLDFGATNSYTKKLRKEVRSILQACFDHKREDVYKIAYRAKILDPRESEAIHEQFYKLMQAIVEIFRPEHQPFRYDNSEYIEKVRSLSLKFAGSVQYTAPAKQLIFLNRKLGGMFHLLKDLGVRTDLHLFWQQIKEIDLD